MTVQQLPIPSFFDPSKIGDLAVVPYIDRMYQGEQWAKDHDVQPSVMDSFRVCLMLIDMQTTFCFPDGQLYVAGRSGAGALDDSRRVCEFIYRNLPYITSIAATMDTHRYMAIFHPSFWVDPDGKHPDPMTNITSAEVHAGKWKVNPGVSASVSGGDYMKLQRHAAHYVEELEKGGRYSLTIWPFHGMLGGVGHALVPAIEEAAFFHAAARSSQTEFEVKGGNFLTENYSVLSPEVLTGPDGEPIDQKNSRFLNRLLSFDAVIVAGEAASHCVAWTIADLLSEMATVDPELAKKVYIMTDCTSAVVVPGVVDYTADALAAFDRFEKAGMHLVKSTDTIDSWPQIKL